MRQNALRLALGAAVFLASLSVAEAAQKTITTKDAPGTGTLSFCGFDAGSFGVAPCQVPISSNGVELFTSGNPGTVTISGAVPLPTGASTLTAQTAGNASLASIDGKTPAASTLPTLANQAAGNASLATIATASGTQATAAKQDTGNGSLATIATNTAGAATAALQAVGNTKLDTLIGQAAPVGAVGATPATGALFPWVQQAPGATFNVTGTLTTKAGIALVSPAYRIASSAAGNNAQVFAVGAKQMLHVYFCNKASSDRVVKFYDKATTPVPGTDTIVTTIPAPAATCAAVDFSGGGFPFALGLAGAITLPGDSDTGSSVAAGDIVGLNIQHN